MPRDRDQLQHEADVRGLRTSILGVLFFVGFLLFWSWSVVK